MRIRTVPVLLAALLVLLVLPGLARGAAVGWSQPSAAKVESRFSYTVRPGDTLWSIALRIAPDGDPRPLVDQLAADNHVRGALQAGQTLSVPAPVR